MTPADQIEFTNAQYVLQLATQRANYHCQPPDRAATIVAILCRAVELATPDFTPAMRARLFEEDAA